MEKNGWKVLAIIFIILFIVETTLWIWLTMVYIAEEEQTYECYYDLCGEYADASYVSPVCYCYQYDILGDLVVAETHYIN